MESRTWSYGSKPTLLRLRELYGVNIVELANKSGVEPSIVYGMLLSRPVSRSHAVLVIEGLNRLVGVNYTLDTVEVALSDDT